MVAYMAGLTFMRWWLRAVDRACAKHSKTGVQIPGSQKKAKRWPRKPDYIAHQSAAFLKDKNTFFCG